MSTAPQRELPARYERLPAARARFGDRVDRLGAYLWALDPPADAAVRELGPGPATDALIGRALDGGEDGPAALRALIGEARRVPPWVDWDRIDRAGRFFLRTGLLGGLVLGGRSLILGYASPGGNKPLVLSGRLREAAAPRLHETSRFVRAVVRKDGMRPGGQGWKITLRVRLMHARVRQMIEQSGAWRAAEWGAPINQHDMVATSLLFSSVTLEGLRALGVQISPRESDEFMHLWRWVSQLIGVEPGLMPANEDEGHRLGELIAATQAPPDEDSRALTAALIEHALSHPDPEERRRAAQTLGLGRAICRRLLGDELADQLAIPRTRERFLLPPAIATIKAVERARARSPRLEERMVARGERYWDTVVDKGLAYATNDFALPATLRT